MTFRDLFFFVLGLNAGFITLFVMVSVRWSVRHADALFSELVRWMESK